MEDFEEQYNEKVEAEGEVLLEGLKNKRSLSELEKEYSKRVKEIRKIYEKSLKKDILQKERYVEKEEKQNSEKKETKEFQVQMINLEKNWKEKKEIEIHSGLYKFKRRIKNIINNITPNFIIYTYHKFKIVLNSFSKDTKFFFKQIKEKISSKLLKIIISIKEGGIFISLNIKKILSIFRKKKEEKPKKEEDGTKQTENPSK